MTIKHGASGAILHTSSGALAESCGGCPCLWDGGQFVFSWLAEYDCMAGDWTSGSPPGWEALGGWLCEDCRIHPEDWYLPGFEPECPDLNTWYIFAIDAGPYNPPYDYYFLECVCWTTAGESCDPDGWGEPSVAPPLPPGSIGDAAGACP